MLVDLKYIINLAEKGEFCIPAFNVYNLETAMGVIQAAQEQKTMNLSSFLSVITQPFQHRAIKLTFYGLWQAIIRDLTVAATLNINGLKTTKNSFFFERLVI